MRDHWLLDERGIIIHDRPMRVAGGEDSSWTSWAVPIGMAVVFSYWLWPVAVGAIAARIAHQTEAVKW